MFTNINLLDLSELKMVSHVDFLNACGKGNLWKIEKYLDLGNDVNAPSDCGTTGLRNACVGDHSEIVKYLLENDANPNQEIWLKSRVSGQFICEKGFVIFYARSSNVVDMLVEHGAELSSLDGHGVSVKEWWKMIGRDEKFIASYF